MKMLIFIFVWFFVSAFSSIAKSSSTIQIYQKSQTSPQLDSTESKSAKNSSATPTPTVSNQDVVRIYVPPADDMIPDKNVTMRRERGDDEVSQSSNRSSIIHVEYETLPFERSSSHMDNPLQKSPSKNDQPSTGANKFQPQQYYYYPNPNPNQTLYQSSSSRRGSMTRKTPSPLLNELIVECDHMKVRRSQENVSEDFSINGSSNTNSNKFYQFNANTYNNNNNNSLKRLTSFEELAKKSENNSLLYIHETSADNNFRQLPQSNSKPKSDYNICYNYKNLDNREELNYTNIKQQSMIKKSASHSHNIRRGDRKHSSSENSPFDYDLLKEKRKENRFMYDDDVPDGKPLENNENSIKSYDRFFNSDDELEDDEIRHNRASKKSSSSGTHKYRSHISGTEADDDDENSSNSPTNKSILNTPIFETMPLLSTDSDATAYLSQPLPALPSSSNSLRHKSKIPRPRGSSSNNNSLRKNSSVSSPESEGYQTTVNRFEKPAAGLNQTGSSSKGSDNKIRIKINQQ